MPKPRIPNSRKAALEHRKRIERYVALIGQLYDRLDKEAAKLALSTGHDPAEQFLWSDYPETARALRKLQERYMADMKAIVMAGTSAEWKESDLVQDLVARKVLKAYTGTTKAGEEYARYFETDPDALKAFQQRRTAGMDLSRRVWNLSEQYRTELEMAVTASIEPGTSAIELAADIRRCLDKPDMMFRRFRYKDEEGDWRRKWKQKVMDGEGKVRFIDADPREYHPGRGVYRSSARNAQRLARTEINMAYRTAEQKRWEKFDFVVGYEVKTTQNGKHVTDICDDLAGKYPKMFVFKGWHPMCMCYCIPILKTEDEFWLLDEDAKSVNEVTDVPKGFKEWIKDNAERIERAEKRGVVPYFIQDNRETVKDILKKETAREKEHARIEANRQEYVRLKADPNYTDVEFNPSNGGLRATHIEHNFDGDKGWYEEHVQRTGYINGHSIILEKEIHTIKNKRNVEGLFDNQSFEIAGAETGIANNIRNALKHCASKPECKVAIVFFPDENKVDMAKIRDGLRKYFGLRGDPNQYKDFDHIYIMTSKRIIYHQKKQGD